MTKMEKKMGKPSLSELRGPVHPERVKMVSGKKGPKEEKRWGFRYEYHMRWWDKENSSWEKEERWFETQRARDQAYTVFVRRMEQWKWYRNPEKIGKLEAVRVYEP